MTQHVLMVAAENDALPHCKVGGIGDVLRDLPTALAALERRVSVVVPSYGLVDQFQDADKLAQLNVLFRGRRHVVELYEVARSGAVRQLVLDHPAFSPCGRGVIYCDDPPSTPFATDASKYALFCAAVAEALRQGKLGSIDVLHLHDWHAALLLALRRYHPAYRCLQALRVVYTVHNLSLQGVRPLRGDPSSLESWFPELHYDAAQVSDPRWAECINLTAVGIRLADAVHTVSASYAEEVLRPSAVATCAYHGGEGLEDDLIAAQRTQRLHGFLNGCEYPPKLPKRASWKQLRQLMRTTNLQWAGASGAVSGAHFVAQARLDELGTRRPPLLLTSVGRITAQKVRLLSEPASDGRAALEGILDRLGDDGLLIVLGNGDPALERFFAQTSGRRRELLFLRGYSNPLAQALYAAGDLFLMPSSFEPCGISQMLAMRAGQPCLVHRVGGLKDTVEPGVNGFGFNGATLLEQTDGLLSALDAALDLRKRRPAQWKALGAAAAAARFPWRVSAEACLHKLYQPLEQR